MAITPTATLQCLAEPTRLRALLLLNHWGALCVCDLQAALGESQPKISRHLRSLRDGGLVHDERRGRWVYYALASGRPPWLKNLLTELSHAHPEILQADLQRLGSPQACEP
jgi:ArsR family transcriptional regulator